MKDSQYKRKKVSNWLDLLTYIIFIGLLIISVFAAPEPPINFTNVNSTRHNISSVISLAAQAGNVTSLTMNVTTASSTWAAYYGNINGTIVLNNANEASIYSWEIDKPTGEVYMANESISFSNIECWNDTETDSGSYYTLSEFESWLGVTSDAPDGVNETFSTIGTGPHDAFYVGTTFIAANSCPSTSMYNSTGGRDPSKFQEVLLYEPSQQIVIYTALIESNEIGFDGNIQHFQMIVGENGYNNLNSTDYYVYLELG